ncbi:flavodoxin domain-containing protein [Thalassotalea ponticola]|uniref:flavodoxin domain-containing protein n=1 Tax=Thalassotalea ponticola TaxID=1523392 RepID=UPI0025B3D409|nr:flavodoxin domain-containing protein [Thalassotalea ponticola]MDN3653069.1 flavodoxin domain-containing protein [Thalassotalea ponticola]
MASFQIIVGSMLGNTEYIAEAAETVLQELGHTTAMHFQPEFSQIDKTKQTWLLCTSTHGAGDFPENLEKFIHDLQSYDQPLADLSFIVIGVGDSSYDTFCQAGKTLYNIMLEKKATPISPLFTIDMIEIDDPESEAEKFIRSISDQL